MNGAKDPQPTESFVTQMGRATGGHRRRTQGRRAHPPDVTRVYARVLARSSVRSRHVEGGAGEQVHLLEKGAGPPVVLLHGTGNAAGFLLPLLNELEGVQAIAPDLPGAGLSDPIDLRGKPYLETTVEWVDGLLDTLGLDTTTLLAPVAPS